MTGNMFGARVMHEAEANDQGIVYRHGWTHFECPDCADVVYDGRQIDADATERMRAAHRIACAMRPGGTTP